MMLFKLAKAVAPGCVRLTPPWERAAATLQISRSPRLLSGGDSRDFQEQTQIEAVLDQSLVDAVAIVVFRARVDQRAQAFVELVPRGLEVGGVRSASLAQIDGVLQQGPQRLEIVVLRGGGGLVAQRVEFAQ